MKLYWNGVGPEPDDRGLYEKTLRERRMHGKMKAEMEAVQP